MSPRESPRTSIDTTSSLTARSVMSAPARYAAASRSNASRSGPGPGNPPPPFARASAATKTRSPFSPSMAMKSAASLPCGYPFSNISKPLSSR